MTAAPNESIQTAMLQICVDVCPASLRPLYHNIPNHGIAIGIHRATIGIILALIYTGFRPSELLALRTVSYDTTLHTLTGGSKSKAGRERVVPVHIRIQPIVDGWLKTGGDMLLIVNDTPPSA